MIKVNIEQVEHFQMYNGNNEHVKNKVQFTAFDTAELAGLIEILGDGVREISITLAETHDESKDGEGA